MMKPTNSIFRERVYQRNSNKMGATPNLKGDENEVESRTTGGGGGGEYVSSKSKASRESNSAKSKSMNEAGIEREGEKQRAIKRTIKPAYARAQEQVDLRRSWAVKRQTDFAESQDDREAIRRGRN
jgi:hypothetical protein